MEHTIPYKTQKILFHFNYQCNPFSPKESHYGLFITLNDPLSTQTDSARGMNSFTHLTKISLLLTSHTNEYTIP